MSVDHPPAVDRHDLLLRLGGRLGDDLVARGRALLADGSYHDVDALLAAHWDLIAPPPSRPGAPETVPAFGFAPAGPAALAVVGDRIGAALDLTGGPDTELGELTDEVDAVAVAAASVEPAGIGLWRTWRFPTHQSAANRSAVLPLARLHLVELARGTSGRDLAAAAGRLQDALRSAGVVHPLVEAYDTGRALPTYQAAARAGAALLWARRPWTAMPLARTFDHGSPPGFRADHEVIPDSPRRSSLLASLHAGATLLASPSQWDDVVSGERAVVPLGFRTDGRWIWTAAVAYYLDVHGLAPDPQLCRHLATAGPDDSIMDGVALHRATSSLSR